MRNYSFKPSKIAWVGLWVLTPLFVSLAIWQWHRADEKEALERDRMTAAQKTPILGGSLLHDAVEQDRYRRVLLEGVYDGDHSVLVDNQIQGGEAGYHVLVPLHLEGREDSVLVNRGWVPLGKDRRVLPGLQGLPSGRVQVAGKIERLHRVGFKIQGMERPSPGWPSVVQVPEALVLQEHLGYPLMGFQVLLDPGEPGSLVYPLPSRLPDPQRSRGYALQWLLFALIVVILFIRKSFHFRTRSS